jgi:serine/threonine protein kinase
LIDFGHAEIISENESIEKLRRGFNYGTTYYTCPEGHYERIYSSKSDIWSLGICLSLLVTGDYPFHGKRHEYYRNSIHNNLCIKDVSPEMEKLIHKTLNSIPYERPTIREFIKTIKGFLEEMDNIEPVD